MNHSGTDYIAFNIVRKILIVIFDCEKVINLSVIDVHLHLPLSLPSAHELYIHNPDHWSVQKRNADPLERVQIQWSKQTALTN